MTRPYALGEVLCDEYVVRLPLGAGGMGEVYLVEHTASGELRAAKVMRVRDDATPADLVSFRREALSLLNIGPHPMIVKLFDVRERGKDIVLLMEYVAPASGCTSLHDLIVRKQDYTDRLLGAWAVQFCVGMEHALDRGMAVHRDIKPANLLWGDGPWLKIADFGLALAVSTHPALIADSSKKKSRLQWMNSADGHDTSGTPGYVAPELFFGGKASQQSDMFSFGVTLWQLAARSLASPYDVAFRGNSAEYQRAVLDKAIAHHITRIDTPFFEVIHRCMAPDPARRYPDFSALREAIKSAVKADGIAAIDFIVCSGYQAGSFDDYVNRGRSLLVLGRYERALSILDQAVKHNPNSYSAQVARAEALVHRGKYLEAVRAYETAHEIEPEALAPLTGKAIAWLALDLPEKARASLDQALARQPKNLEALLLLARIFGEGGDADAALSVIETVIAMDPQDWRAHQYHGSALWGLGKLADAARAYKTLDINPLALDARLHLASLLTRQKELAAAAKEYERAIRIFRDNSEVLNTIAAHMAEHGHEKKAIDLFQELADLEPASRSIMMVNIGNAQLRLGDSQSAVLSYRKAIETEPENALGYYRLGDLSSEDGRNDKAAEYFARACELESDNPRYHSLAGTAYLQEKDFHRAVTYLRRSIELFPEQPLMLYNLAVALCFEGDEESAAEELTKAVRIDEQYARGWYLKAQIEAGLGRTMDAAASARHAAINSSALSAKESEGAHALLKQLSGDI